MEEQMSDGAKKFRENIFTSSVKAGKRTYYFDVKETKNGERYITVTERKRRYNEDGSYKVEKHKIFLYKEDFDKFADALDDVIEYVESDGASQPKEVTKEDEEKIEDKVEDKVEDKTEKIKDEFTDVSFEDLDDVEKV